MPSTEHLCWILIFKTFWKGFRVEIIFIMPQGAVYIFPKVIPSLRDIACATEFRNSTYPLSIFFSLKSRLDKKDKKVYVVIM